MKRFVGLLLGCALITGCGARVDHDTTVTVKIRQEFVERFATKTTAEPPLQMTYGEWTYEPDNSKRYKNGKPEELAKDAADEAGERIVGQVAVSLLEVMVKGSIELIAEGMTESTDFRCSISDEHGGEVFFCKMGYNSFPVSDELRRILHRPQATVRVTASGKYSYLVEAEFSPNGTVKAIDIDCGRDGRLRVNGVEVEPHQVAAGGSPPR